MAHIDLDALITALDVDCREYLEQAASGCVTRGGYEVSVEDMLLRMAEGEGFLHAAFAQFDVDKAAFLAALQASIVNRTQHSQRPVLSRALIELLENAFLVATLELGRSGISAGAILLALLKNANNYIFAPWYQVLENIPADKLQSLVAGLHEEAAEQAGGSGGRPVSSGGRPGGESALEAFTTDFTREAREGRIDPVLAREQEILQTMDILSRRRKNNPIIVGDAGVGKTAIVEGLALRIVSGDVPDTLLRVRLCGLDMGRLQAGAGIKGEFEKRLKAVIDEVKTSPEPVVLFIDEAHTLVGGGAQAGGGDAANLLKPALARGEVRTIAATTWSEYKKYFEKDPALARRFQPVKADEPSLEQCAEILEGIAGRYEQEHGVYVRQDALREAVQLSARYITGRQLPDKAIDVLDTACARVRVSLTSRPAALQDLQVRRERLQREYARLSRDLANARAPEGTPERLEELRAEEKKLAVETADLEARWEREKELCLRLLEARKAIATQTDTPESPADAKASPLFSFQADVPTEQPLGSPPEADGDAVDIPALQAELDALQGEAPLVHYEVSPGLVASVVSSWTGIPLGRMVYDTAAGLLSLGSALRRHIRGQEHAVEAIDQAARAARLGLKSPNTPSGVFLLVGPSGVGKTETALAVAEHLYGGERFMTTLNMSEFQEKHTVSRLIGSPPGYVGFGEGGVLTEAVRQRPYSLVLFDEVEKADPDVLNLFYQIFDKGMLADGEGREIDFKNTTLFLTSNLGSDIIEALCEDALSAASEGSASPEEGTPPSEGFPPPEEILDAIRPTLSRHFKPALLARMTIIPYYPISPSVMREIVDIKLDYLARRMSSEHNIALSWTPRLADHIAQSCTVMETGARNILHVINARLLPQLSRLLLTSLTGENRRSDALRMDVEDGAYICAFV